MHSVVANRFSTVAVNTFEPLLALPVL